MSTAPKEVLDHGLEKVRLTVVAQAHPDKETSYHIPAATLAQSAGVHGKDPCLLGALAHTLTYEKVDAPFHVGIVAASGDQSLGKVATHVISSPLETGAYHVVASKGSNVYNDPVSIDISHPGNVHENTLQMIKRGTRWSDDVGKTARDLIKGLEAHEGVAADGTSVRRVLVPVAGSHPCSRALQLNADTKDGPFSQYSTKNRKVVKVGGADHIIVERDHLDSMATTLADNLSASTQLGKHGMTLKFKPLAGVTSARHNPGKIVIHMSLHKHAAKKVLDAGDAFAHPPLHSTLDAGAAGAHLDGGAAPGLTVDDAETNVKMAVLSAKLAAPSSNALPAVTPIASAGADFASSASVADAAPPSIDAFDNND